MKRKLVLRIVAIFYILVASLFTVCCGMLLHQGVVDRLDKMVFIGFTFVTAWFVAIMYWIWSKPSSSSQNSKP